MENIPKGANRRRKADLHKPNIKEGEESPSKCQFWAKHRRGHDPGPPSNRPEKDGGQALQLGYGAHPGCDRTPATASRTHIAQAVSLMLGEVGYIGVSMYSTLNRPHISIRRGEVLSFNTHHT